jgi:hypothetical protein
LALPLFAATLFVSAFILFLVQPIIGKMILPALGGTPQVWNTCMVFFQAALLAGYAYTHTVSTRLPLRKQLILHGALLFLPIILLLLMASQSADHSPFSVLGFRPPPGGNPIPYTLFQLTLMVGLPFFVVATSAPLLQKWFASTGHPAAKDPYFLYAASNAGSLIALVAYPFVVEPFLLLRQQAWTWTIGYSLLLLLVIVCILLVWKVTVGMRLAPATGLAAPPKEESPPPGGQTNPPATGVTAAPPASAPQTTAIKKPPKHLPKAREEELIPSMMEELTTQRKVRWVALAAIPVSLMLGVTTHITTDLSPSPTVWLVPLTLYLLSFILVFSRWPVVWTEKPHQFFLALQPVALGLMIFMDFYATREHYLRPLIIFLVLGFFWTAMVCHGELARDRPGTKHLTEFYLWLSVGGVTGGIFNGLIAPIMSPQNTPLASIWEFPVAIMVACFLRPTMKESGWTDDIWTNIMEKPTPQPQIKKGHKHQHQPQPKASATPSFHYTMDVALPIGILILIIILAYVVFPERLARLAYREDPAEKGLTFFLLFGIPLMICCFYYGRPVRFGLGIGVILLSYWMLTERGGGDLFAARSYFGVIRVSQRTDKLGTYTSLTHGTTLHGQNYRKPEKKEDWGQPDKDLSRLATTYYHAQGPAGRAMDRFNWAKDRDNKYHSDARMPATLIGLGGATFGGNLPLDQLVDLWSEPPYATIGLGTGTMASYARPFQHIHFYEIDNIIRRLSLPGPTLENFFSRKQAEDFQGGGTTYFTYLREALGRGANVQVLMGDARLRMNQKYVNYYQNEGGVKGWEVGGGPESFYQLMVVDAFSSDAIPVHLITQQAIKMYFKHLTPDGVLCVHTSNRHVDLVKVVADVADSIIMTDLDGIEKKLVCKVGHDQLDDPTKSTSEWVMVARDRRVLDGGFVKGLESPLTGCQTPDNYDHDLDVQNKAKNLQMREENKRYWKTPEVSLYGRYVWTDDYSNLFSVLR